MSNGPSSSNLDQTYRTLEKLLHPSSARPQELAILPSSTIPCDIQHDPVHYALAIPTSLLLSCFLQARHVFFDSYNPARLDRQLSRNELQSPVTSASRIELLHATSVILLWEPNHQTAANWRKRYLLSLMPTSSYPRNGVSSCECEQTIQTEWAFLTSLLTSPLPPHHAKSPTLWFQRLWILQTFDFHPTNSDGNTPTTSNPSVCRTTQTSGAHELDAKFWQDELDVVMQAGERHPRNYYAWSYARRLWRHLFSKEAQSKPEETHDFRRDVKLNVWGETVHGVLRWCFAHPRDISGWSFLLFVLDCPPAAFVQHDPFAIMPSDMPSNRTARELRACVRAKAIEFKEKYSWNGESINWFLHTSSHTD